MSYTQRIEYEAALLRIEDRTCVLALETNQRNKVSPTSTGISWSMDIDTQVHFLRSWDLN